MGRKSDDAVLTRLIERFGDLIASELRRRVRSPRTGRTRRWDVDELTEIYLGVEAIRDKGFQVMEACREYKRFSELSINVVEKRYFEARKRFDHPVRAKLPEILPGFLDDRPSFAKFVRKLRLPKVPRLTC